MADKTMELSQARWRLARVWFAGASLIGIILIIQSVGRYQNVAPKVWGWALPSVMPTLSLIISVLGGDALDGAGAVEVRRAFFQLSYWMSASYLTLVLATILIEPLTSLDPLDLLNLSNLWLGPCQGLTVLALGKLFFSRPEK